MYNASDDAPQKMGDYFDLVADRFGLPRPPRVSRAEAARSIPEGLLSFMNESRRLTNRRIKQELRLRLRYPTVREGIAAACCRSRQPRHDRMPARARCRLVLTNLPDREAALKLARALVEQQLAACVNVLARMHVGLPLEGARSKPRRKCRC